MSLSQRRQITGMLPVRELAAMLENGSSGLYERLRELYPAAVDLREKAGLCLDAVKVFCEHFGARRDVFLVRSAGRVNLLGMHVDHRGGFVNPIAIREVFFVVEPRQDDVVQMHNAEEELFGPRTFRISDELPKHKINDWDSWTHDEFEQRQRLGTVGDWANYVKSAVLYLQHLNTKADGSFEPRLCGMNMAVRGNVPRAAGLSSSSSIVVGSMEACMKVNGLDIPPLEMIEDCRLAEWYVGTRGGGGDHAAIKFGRKDHILHVGSFPFSVTQEPFPSGYSVVLADSLVQSLKQERARERFNEAVASYVFGLLLLRKRFPEYGQKMEHLRDVNPERLGVSEGQIYRMIRTLPEHWSREQVLAELPEEEETIERTFRSHGAPVGGYRIRQVCTYGIAECIRSEMAGELLRRGQVKAFGELINISHDGDRVSRLVDDKRVPQDNSISDAKLDELISAAESDDARTAESWRLWRQPGGYDVSTPEQDALVDIARTVPGVLAAGLVGAGLGGSIIALVEQDRAQGVIEAFAEEYYEPRGQAVAAEVVCPVGGSGVIDLRHSNKT